MKYMSGGSLADLLSKGPQPFEQSQKIFKEVCDGLQVLHAQKWVHRDMKPANVLFDGRGRAVVSDFGLALSVESSGGSSGLGIAGTPFYRAPEMWRGKPPVSPATDVYALGCILYEMLAGKVLFSGDTPDEIITKHLIDGPEFVPDWPPVSAPPGLAEVVDRALARDPAKRYQEASAFWAALQRITEDQDRKAAEEKRRLEAEVSARLIATEQALNNA
jgi:serine/threonine-protein kinase